MFNKVIAHTSFIGTTGYNNHARNFFTHLNKFIPVKIRNYTIGNSWKGLSNTPHDEESYLTSEHKKMLLSQTLRDKDNNRHDYPIYSGISNFKAKGINIVLNTIDHYYFYDEYNNPKIAYNVWESTRQPDNFFKRLLEFDQLWVPTKWQKKCSIEQGYPKDRIKIVPEGVDGNIFFPEKLKKEELLDEYKDGRFKFLLFGRWEYRKSTKEIIETFLKTFKSEPVDLIISADNFFSVDGLTTEEKLSYYNLNDKKIKVKHFPSRKDYIKYIKTGNVFVSCSRGEGWNLPLCEAAACGIPTIASNWGAQLEFCKNISYLVNIVEERPASLGKSLSFIKEIPGNYCEPDFNHLGQVMKDVYENYDKYKEKSIKNSRIIRDNFSWENAAEKAYEILKSIKKNFLAKNKNFYKKFISFSFIKNPYLKIKGKGKKDYIVQFTDKRIDKVIYKDIIKANQWVKAYRKWYTDWLISVESEGKIIFKHNFSLKNKNVYIHLESKSLGDTIAWFPYVEEFRKKHKCKIIVSTFWNSLFEKKYKKLLFVKPGEKVNNIYASYEIGWFTPWDKNKNPQDFRTIPLQKTSSDILGLNYKEIKPKIVIPNKSRNIKEKYVCIAVHSTSQGKYWNYPGGWQKVVNYLNNRNYKVVCLSKEKEMYMSNKLPRGIIDKTGNIHITNRIIDLKYASLFIGVSSGLSWLAWAIGTPVILISGITASFCEFKTGIRKIQNLNVCNGCFNDPDIEFDKGDWNWCPRKKNFECTKKITPEMVIVAISSFLK